jgi:hypothetical protein
MLVWRVAGMTVGARMLGVVTAQRGGDGGGPGWVPARQGYRCGIEDKRLNPSEARTSELIAAFAIDGADKRSAETRFAQIYFAGAFAEFDRQAGRILRGNPQRTCLGWQTSRVGCDWQQKEWSDGSQ